MSAARIGALGLRLQRPERAAPASRLIEDAFRTAGLANDGRLLVLRRLDLGRVSIDGSHAMALSGRIAELLRTAAFDAVDAAAPAAHQADAVVFPSAESARAALAVALLLRGRPPAGWWWRSAVPEWRAEADPAPLLKALSQSPQGRVALALAVASVTSPDGPATIPAVSPPLAAALLAIWPGTQDVVRVVDAPKRWVALQRRIALAPHLASIRSWAQRIVAERQPEVASAQTAAASGPMTAVETDQAGVGRSAVSRVIVRGEWIGIAPSDATGPIVADVRRDEPPPSKREALLDSGVPEAKPPTREAGLRSAAPDIPLALSEERATKFAGLLLVIGPLRRLGFESWLARHPARAESGFGWRLLDHVAARAQAGPDDPSRLILHPTETDDATDDAVAWRAALDGLMRRRTRQPLSRIVRRRGWIVRHEASIEVRFPADAADVALRRHGYDIDPGFVPWLGLSVSYRYDDRRTP